MGWGALTHVFVKPRRGGVHLRVAELGLDLVHDGRTGHVREGGLLHFANESTGPKTGTASTFPFRRRF